jgi:hypothetical protein
MPVDMRRMFGRFGRGIGLGAALVGVCAWGQTHKVAKPEQVVRAVGVYEWTGDISKPTASRLVPITVFIEGRLEDAGVYLERPVPFALLTGNLYELQQAGIPRGSVELRYAKHFQAVDTATGANLFDDGWFGYGVYRAPAAPKKAPVLVATRNMPQITTSKNDDGKPHFSNAPSKGSDSDSSTTTASASGASSGSGSGSGSSGSAGDPDRPTMKRRTGSDSSAGSSAGNTSSADTSAPADDPDRPRLSKRSGSGDSDDSSGGASGSTASSAGSGSASGDSGGGSSASKTTTTASGGSADDPDRPTLKRRSPEETKKQGQKEASASVTGVGSLNDDPDRPVMQHGKPANAMGESDLPKMTGLPADLNQLVAVSDAADRQPHEFARAWEDDAERAAVLQKMQALARAKIAEYAGSAGGSGASAATTAKTGAAVKPATAPSAASAAAARRKAAAAPAAAPVELQEEILKGYTLSYGGAPTYVYSAHTPGAGATLDFVTVVAQADVTGELKAAISSVTDAAHLDRTPWMRLVDVVDVEASNRASLLFELRGSKTREFGLYRVIGSKADQMFVTGATQ